MTTAIDTSIYHRFAISKNDIIHKVAKPNGRRLRYAPEGTTITSCGMFIDPASWTLFALRNSPAPEGNLCGRCFKD